MLYVGVNDLIGREKLMMEGREVNCCSSVFSERRWD